MKLSSEERAARRTAFQNMRITEKLDYLFTYYKLPILLGLIAAVVLSSAAARALTKKDALFYMAYVNVAVGEDLDMDLRENYIAFTGADARKTEIYVYPGLYLSEDPAVENHEYSYASRLKILAAINAKQLDAVLMNREAYDIFSRSGYLLNLSDVISCNAPVLYARLLPYFIENEVILEDNAIEYNLNEAGTYYEETQSVVNGIIISNCPLLSSAGFPDAVYLGIIANSQHLAETITYLDYLFSVKQTAS